MPSLSRSLVILAFAATATAHAQRAPVPGRYLPKEHVLPNLTLGVMAEDGLPFGDIYVINDSTSRVPKGAVITSVRRTTETKFDGGMDYVFLKRDLAYYADDFVVVQFKIPKTKKLISVSEPVNLTWLFGNHYRQISKRSSARDFHPFGKTPSEILALGGVAWYAYLDDLPAFDHDVHDDFGAEYMSLKMRYKEEIKKLPSGQRKMLEDCYAQTLKILDKAEMFSVDSGSYGTIQQQLGLGAVEDLATTYYDVARYLRTKDAGSLDTPSEKDGEKEVTTMLQYLADKIAVDPNLGGTPSNPAEAKRTYDALVDLVAKFRDSLPADPLVRNQLLCTLADCVIGQNDLGGAP